MERLQQIKVVSVAVSLGVFCSSVSELCAADRAELNREELAALNRLYSISPAARRLSKSAKAVLVFPSIIRVTSSTTTQHAYGTLLANARSIGYYKLVGSYSLPRGVQKFAYALFFMSEQDLAQLRNSSGREIAMGVQENQKPKQQATAPAPVNTNADEPIGTESSPTSAGWHSSAITHRPAMNDQQEPAPRPNDFMLGPTYGGLAPAPEMSVPRAPAAAPRNGIYVFAFSETGLIPGLSLAGTKITPIKKTEKP